MESNISADFTNEYASLGADGAIKTFAGGDAFWSLSADALNEIGQNWLITEFDFVEDWNTWEMHPNGEEIVYLLSGAMDLTLDKEGELQTVELRSKGLMIIPRNTWHTARVIEPSKMLVITFGKDSQIKPI